MLMKIFLISRSSRILYVGMHYLFFLWVVSEIGSINRRFLKAETQIHVTALDEVVSVNSFFTVAVFIGLSFTSQSHNSHADAAAATSNSAENEAKCLLVFEVIAFGCFLFSSLVAHGMKLFIVFANSTIPEEPNMAPINQKLLRTGIIASAIGSVSGTVFLLLSMVNIIQLKLGNLTSRNAWADSAALPLIVLVGSGVAIFSSSVFYAALH
ncbi:hypothetical protein O6H91_01G025500 [Diphasiastrum complanatum]|uniref:Uncharacterized protein n=1 Tax=Diphasiastrum complanatum TaxID=34168 RepID=A0ACC2EP53_DIPCM|nr:hypothetical protein O6H91_01G025500 [Diphasiastrum complanatum]